jgi:hypothetical protein
MSRVTEASREFAKEVTKSPKNRKNAIFSPSTSVFDLSRRSHDRCDREQPRLLPTRLPHLTTTLSLPRHLLQPLVLRTKTRICFCVTDPQANSRKPKFANECHASQAPRIERNATVPAVLRDRIAIGHSLPQLLLPTGQPTPLSSGQEATQCAR